MCVLNLPIKRKIIFKVDYKTKPNSMCHIFLNQSDSQRLKMEKMGKSNNWNKSNDNL